MNAWFIDENNVLRLVEGTQTEGYALKCWAKDNNATMLAGGVELQTAPKKDNDTPKKAVPFLTQQTILDAQAILDEREGI